MIPYSCNLSLSLSIILLLSTRNLFFFSYIRCMRDNTFFAIDVSKCCRNAIINFTTPNVYVGRGSSVGIATRYGLDVPVIESQWG